MFSLEKDGCHYMENSAHYHFFFFFLNGRKFNFDEMISDVLLLYLYDNSTIVYVHTYIYLAFVKIPYETFWTSCLKSKNRDLIVSMTLVSLKLAVFNTWARSEAWPLSENSWTICGHVCKSHTRYKCHVRY